MNSSSHGRPLATAFLHLVFAAVALVAVPATVLRKLVVDLGSRDAWILALVALGYGVWFLWLVIRRSKYGQVSVWRMLAVGLIASAPAVLAGVVLYRGNLRPLLVQSLLVGLSLALLLILIAWRRKGWPAVLAAAVVATLGIVLQVLLARGDVFAPARAGVRTEAQLGSALYDLTVESYTQYFPAVVARQGGISAFGDRYILVDGDGNLFLFRRTQDGGNLEVQRLPHRVPMNRDAFETAGGPTVGKRTWFRVADVLAQPTTSGHRIFVTHHYWNVTGNYAAFLLTAGSRRGRSAAAGRRSAASTGVG